MGIEAGSGGVLAAVGVLRVPDCAGAGEENGMRGEGRQARPLQGAAQIT